MKSFVALGVLLFSGSVFAANPMLSCRVSMLQFKSDQKMFPVIGDSNQRLKIDMKPDGANGLRGEAQVRFMNDQSSDNTNSLHGAKAIVLYQPGNGLLVSMKILKFADHSDTASSEAVTSVVGATHYDLDLKAASKNLRFGHINPKSADTHMDLWTLVNNKEVEDYEVHSVLFEGCIYRE